jgi:hypothetical protein
VDRRFNSQKVSICGFSVTETLVGGLARPSLKYCMIREVEHASV